MSDSTQHNAFLLLEEGNLFEGYAAGIKGTVGGEICFNTSMTGYQEIYTDPSYFGQIMVNTNVHIGNYGAKSSDTESDAVQIRGLVCRNFSNHFSRASANQSLQTFLEENRIVCIHGIDTRALVRHIRIHGAMNAVISTESQIIQTKKPVFGICLGHQLISIALGVPTYKMHHGHRGGNHPVLNLMTGLGEITSQNHGFAVDANLLVKRSTEIELTHTNLNDHSVEGLRHKSLPIFAVQYHPAAGPGPHDSHYLIHQFYQQVHSIYQATT